MAKRFLDQRWPWLVGVAIILVAFLSTFVEILPEEGWDSRPLGSAEDISKLRERDDLNVLFILIDTLRADRLSAYGYERATSPTLERLAASGVRFDRHLAQSSWTKTSMASLWTSLYPVGNGITRYDQVLPDEALMPAEIFRDAGFRTAGIYRNGWVAPTFGFGQGFEIYQKSLAKKLPAHVRRENPTVSDRSTDEAAIRSALEFLRLRGNDRWFLYLHLMDLHEYIYDTESAKFGSTYSDIYDNSILWNDRTIEILFDSMRDLGALENTIIVVTSDHGEAFGEHGQEGHGRGLYRETTEVPLMIHFPFRLDPGAVVRTRTRNIDVWPTLLDLVGIEAPTQDGVSRVPEILAAAGAPTEIEPPESTAIAQLDQNWARPGTPEHFAVAVTDGPLRFIRVDSENGRLEQLFDASEDELELRDVAGERGEDLEKLSQVADAYMAREPVWEVSRRELSELELGQLRALGYAVE